MSEDEGREIAKKLFESLDKYQKAISFFATDAPIESLCLQPQIESILIKAGIVRIYDLIGTDFTKIKGLGPIRIKDLTTRLNEFIAM